MSRVGRKWDKEEDDKLFNLLKEGLNIEECAEVHKRKKGGIKSRIRYIIYNKIIENNPIDEIIFLQKYTKININELINLKDSTKMEKNN
jgi:hypothetical protein